MTEELGDDALHLLAQDRLNRDTGERFDLDATMAALSAVAVDFDGVVHRYSIGWHDGTCYDEPMSGAIGALHELMEARPVAIMTARPVHMVADWFGRHAPMFATRVDPDCKISFWGERGTLLITNRKIVAAHYIDDRAIRFTTWPNIKAMVGVYDRHYQLRAQENHLAILAQKVHDNREPVERFANQDATRANAQQEIADEPA